MTYKWWTQHIIMLTLLSTNECTGFDCPILSLPYFLLLYVLVMILTCCCCYPGACLCPQSQKKRDDDGNTDKKPWVEKLNLLGSIGQILHEEWSSNDIMEPTKLTSNDDDNEEEEDKNFKPRRRRIRY